MDAHLTPAGNLVGNVARSETLVDKLTELMLHPDSFDGSNRNDIAYWVETEMNGVKDGQDGGLFFGVSHLNPGTIGDEFIFTRGHYHEARDTGEYYWGLTGNGFLLLHYDNGEEELQRIGPGIVRYIPGKAAHRLINVGTDVLSVGAVWQAISGHDYQGAFTFNNHVLKTDEGYEVVNSK